MSTPTFPGFPPRTYTPGDVVNSVGADQRLSVAGDGALIPEVYGNQRVPAAIVTPVVHTDDKLYLLCVWCLGEIQAINNVYMGDTALPSGQVRSYRGTSTQNVEPWLSAAIAGFSDNMRGVAYSVLQLEVSDGLNSRIWADIDGRNDIYDPRGPSTGYSTNPTLCLANFVDRYLDVSVNWSSVGSTANENDTTVGGVARETLNITMRTPAPVETWAAVLSEYANCFLHYGSELIFTPNRAAGSDHTFTDANILDIRVRKLGMDQQPNRVTVEYTDTSGTEWKNALVTRSNVNGEIREQTLRMPGIQSYGHAYRYAQERLNYYQLTDIRITLTVFDEGLEVIVGDRATVTHKYGLTADAFRVVGVNAISQGRYQLELEGYSASVYVTTNPTAPSLADPTYPTTNDYSVVVSGLVTYYQADAPTGANEGDLWFDTDDDRTYRWDGAAWVEIQDDEIAQALADAANAQTTADNRISTFAQNSSPIANAVGDLWLDTNDNNLIYRWNGSAWVSLRDGTIQVAQADATQALADAAAAQSTADGKVTTFYQASAPTAEGVGDLWYDTDDDKAHRWNGSSWIEITDSDVVQAIADAATAQATADGRIVTFAQNSQPTAVAVGDLWVDTNDNNKLYRWNGSSWQNVRDGTIADAQADATQALADAAAAQGTADGKAVTFYQASAPTAEGVGDLWYDTDDDKAHRWNGSSWIEITDSEIATAIADAATAQATADSRIVTFRQNNAPTAEGVGDLWIDANDNNRLYRWSGSSWVDVRDGTIATAAAQAAQALADAAAAQSSADGKATTFYQSSAPTAEGVGDLWYDTDDNKVHRWSGSSWIEITDDEIAQALSAAATAQSTADGRIVTFAQNSVPTAEGVGDLWVDTNDDNKLYRWNGSSWVDVRDPTAFWSSISGDGQPVLIPPGIDYGGSSNVEFNKNKNWDGAVNTGEIQVTAGSYIPTDGEATRVVDIDRAIYTPYETVGNVPNDNTFYIIWGVAAPWTRFGAGSHLTWGNAGWRGLFAAEYVRSTEQWRAVDNNFSLYNFTPLSTDRLMAVGSKVDGDDRITSINTLVARTGAVGIEDEVTQELVQVGAISAVSQESGVGPILFQSGAAAGSWTTVETVDIDLPSDIADSVVLLDFFADLEIAVSAATPPPEGAIHNTSIRVLDDDNSVIGGGVIANYRTACVMLDSSTTLKTMYGYRGLSLGLEAFSANLNASQSNRFTVQVKGSAAGNGGTVSGRIHDWRLRATLLNKSG